jgi:hypothetical protein
MFAPGAMMSGLRIWRTMWLGPRDEDTTTGARFSPVTVRQVKQNDATGSDTESMCAASLSASRELTVTAGRVNAWTMSPSIRQSMEELEISPLPVCHWPSSLPRRMTGKRRNRERT